MDAVAVPQRLGVSARALGPAGSRWLEDLPDVLAGLAADWSLTYGRPFDGGNAAYVIGAVTAYARPVILKVALPPGVDGAKLCRPCSSAATETAIGYAAERASAFDPGRAVLIHGDGHAGNVLPKPART